MLLTHFIWQTDLKPLSGTNAKNGAIPLSLTRTIHTSHAMCDKASEWVGASYAAMQAWQCVCGGGGEGILRDAPEYKCLCCIQDHHQQFIRSL